MTRNVVHVALVLAAPGWVAVAVVAARRTRGGTSRGRRTAAWAGGALLGIALSAAAAAVVAALLDGFEHVVIVMVLAAWGSCWALALAMHRPGRAARSTTARDSARSGSAGRLTAAACGRGRPTGAQPPRRP